ncbi:MAG: aldo/keto reductase [Paludibacter sp.]|nr:aldo/keto reductase [Paludibacter sp.]
MNSIEKIVLGTVQFGLDYGINNRSGKVSSNDVDSILSLASALGIRCLDTSYAYGESELSIGDSLFKNPLSFDIISKCPKTDSSVGSMFDESIIRLKKDKLYGYLVHNFDFYRSNPDIWEAFQTLKSQGKVTKIGFSIYSVGQLQFLLNNNVQFDLIQFPYNIFDRQFEPYFEQLKQKGVEIHTRSVFLQGLFFKDLNTLEGNLLALKPYLQALHLYCQSRKIQIQQIALNYVVANKNIDGVLIGVDNISQLQSNVDVLNQQIKAEDIEFINSIQVEESDLLNPVNWK